VTARFQPSRRGVLKAATAATLVGLVPGRGASAQDAAAAGATDGFSNLVLWYDKPSTQWVEAMPIGNGRIGGMVHGRVTDERIGMLKEATIKSLAGGRLVIRPQPKSALVVTSDGSAVQSARDEQERMILVTEKGKRYVLKPA